jgi:hypothetical protein
MKKVNLIAACVAVFTVLFITSCEPDWPDYDSTQGAGGELSSSTTIVKEENPVDTTEYGTTMQTSYEMNEKYSAENVLLLDQVSTLIEQKGADRKDNTVRLALNGTATNVNHLVYAKKLTKKYRQAKKGSRSYSDITNNHPDFIGEVEQTDRTDVWTSEDGHEFTLGIMEQNAIAYSAFIDTAVTLQSARIDTAYVSNVEDVKTARTKTIGDSVYAAVDRKVEVTYEGTIVPAIGEARKVSFKRYLTTKADDESGLYEFDHVVVPEDTIPTLPDDTIPTPPDTIPTPPDTIPVPDGYPWEGGKITGIYGSFCLAPNTFAVIWNVVVETEQTVCVMQSTGVGNRVVKSPKEIFVSDPSYWNSANSFGTPAHLVNDGTSATWSMLDGTTQSILSVSIPQVAASKVSIAEGEMIQKIDLRTVQYTETSTIITIPAIPGVRNSYTITVTK